MESFFKLFNQIIYCFKLMFNISKRFLLIRLVACFFLPILGITVSFIDKSIINQIIYGKQAIKLISILCILRVLIDTVILVLGHISSYVSLLQERLLEQYVHILIIKNSTESDITVFDDKSYYDKLLFTQSNFKSLASTIWCVLDGASSFISLIAIAFMFSKYNIFICLVIMISCLPYAIFARRNSIKAYECEMECLSDERKKSYWVDLASQKEFSGIVRLYKFGDKILQNYKSIWKKIYIKHNIVEKKRCIELTILSIFPKVLLGGVALYIALQIISGNGTIGDYSLYTGFSLQILTCTTSLFQTINQLFENQMDLETIKEFGKNTKSVITNGNKQLTEIKKIEFKNVSFCYPLMEKYILKNVSFTLNKNEKLAIVGKNGSGKSTIIKLLLRFYDVNQGKILINNRDIKEYDIESLRMCFSVYMQNQKNLCCSIKDNISMFDDNAEYCKIDDLVKHFDLEQIIEKGNKEKGIEQYLYKLFDEDGIEVSGGENQRIALARTMYRSGSCIILDEHTSAMDQGYTRKINQYIRNKYQNKITLIITHKLNEIDNDTKIIVIKKGSIVGFAEKKELFAKDSVFAKIYN